ncbi:MAG: carbohydrate binding domain-containing protein, partial [Armatimonadetes bacterium]|nr:carbohydrate binding domain-containing protein [Armatimonadota bacterium]
ENPIVCHHTSCWLAIPCISFSHMMLDGEQYHDPGQKVEAHFLDVVPLDKWRAEHTGRQWGPAPFLLPDIPPQYCVDEAATRELLMLTNLHDTGLFPAGNNMRVVMRNYQARRLFGIAECEFRGYWAAEPWARCETPECYVSVYRKPDRSRALLVIGNAALEETAATVRPNLEALGLPTNTDAGVDIETGERVALAAGALRVTVRGRDFRLIALPYYKPPPITAGDYAAMAAKQVPNPGFEEGLDGWQVLAVEGNKGTVEADATEKRSGTYSCHLRKVEGPGGMMVQTEDVLGAEAGNKYRVNCWVKIANATGAKAYWMISMMDSQGRSTAQNNLFYGFLTENQDWKELPFEFELPPGTVVIRLHFLVAFEGAADVWIDDVTFGKVE